MTGRVVVMRGSFLLLIFLAASAFGQGGPEDLSVPAAPRFTSIGIVTTDGGGDALYLVNDRGSRVLLRGPGCGRYYSVSPDLKKLGTKLIDGAGLQRACLVDLESGTVTELSLPARRTGQVSFSTSGRLAFTVEESLVVRDAGAERHYNLGSYANLAPISPDGLDVAFNDGGDQIWILHLPSGVREQISLGGAGYFGPKWSPTGDRLLYCRLDGSGFVYDRSTGKTFSLGEAFGAVWTRDGQNVVFYRKEVVRGELVNSDLFLCRYDGRGLRILTSTPGICEMDPSFSSDGGTLLYHTYLRRTLATETFNPSLQTAAVPKEIPSDLHPDPVRRSGLGKLEALQMLDVPYVNQVYDTPDWFNGHSACGPTTGIMLLAYYHLLPEWDSWCSWPSRHVSPWGSYVAERYYFRQTDYAFLASDPNGTPSYGGYGFMWVGSQSPHSRMVLYYTNHGLSASLSDSPPQSSIVASLASGPVSLCNGLTAAGHIVLVHDLGADPRTFIVNDPYGDKNRTDLPYPNTLGKNAQYDWPGYNNGNMNFNTVYWSVEASYTAPASLDTLVDDLEFSSGFLLANQGPASMSSWRDLNRGYAGHLWWTKTKPAGQDTCFAVWTPVLPREGEYEVFAYIALSNATAAQYQILTRDGPRSVTLDQKNYSESWASLGTFPFSAGSAGTVRLGDASPQEGQELVFDAVRWSYRGPGVAGLLPSETVSLPETPELFQNFPNPFNPLTTIRFALPTASPVHLEVVDLLGQVCAVLIDGEVSAGFHEVGWNAAGSPSGVYLLRLTVSGRGPGYTATRSMVLLK
jgi:hypothetical protein